MSDHLDRDTVERMLRGEDTGPPNVAELLTAMSARPVRKDRRGEETAVAAFREARRTFDVPATAPAPRRLLVSRVLAVKAALAGMLLMLAGGVAVAASPHLPQPHGTRRTPVTHTPTTSQSAAKRLTAAPVPSPAPSSPYPTHDRAHHRHEKAHHASKRPSPYESREGKPSSKERSKDKWGQPVPDLPLPVSRPPVCDALCDLDG